jgi:hypothetical protein
LNGEGQLEQDVDGKNAQARPQEEREEQAEEEEIAPEAPQP